MAIKRKIFYSFYFSEDVFRVQQIRNIGALEENKPVSPNAWEEVRRGKDTAIERWINENMSDKSCVVVLVGTNTYSRPWVRHEIKKAWNEGKGLLGIHIHNLKCPQIIRNNSFASGKSNKGPNPFENFTYKDKTLANFVKCYDPNPYEPNKDIINNLESWVEEAIEIRKRS